VYKASLDTAQGPVRTATATCPPGLTVVGGGGEGLLRTSGTNQLVITELVPTNTTYRVTVTDFHPTSAFDAWNVIAYAICTNIPNDYAIISTPGQSSPQPVQQVASPCPGRQVIGTGAKIHASLPEQVGLLAVSASAALTEVQVVAHDIDGVVSQPWSLTAYSICAESSTSGQRANVTGPVRRALVRSTCPLGFMPGTGVQTSNAPADLAIDRIRPAIDLYTVEVRAKRAEWFNPPPNTDWTVTAQAICNTALNN
jgi:hypothetical protein